MLFPSDFPWIFRNQNPPARCDPISSLSETSSSSISTVKPGAALGTFRMGAATIGPDTKPGGTSGEMMGFRKWYWTCWENGGKMENWMDLKENFESVLLFSIKVGEWKPLWQIFRSPNSVGQQPGASSTATMGIPIPEPRSWLEIYTVYPRVI